MMIRPIEKSDLSACLEIFHLGYETVAAEFGLTEENCPHRGRASLPFEKLVSEYKNGTMMYGYVVNDKIVGYLGIKMYDHEILGLEDIIVLPFFRKLGYGSDLIRYCKKRAKELSASKIRLGMIDDNTRLRKWYEKNGFVNVGYKKYDGAPFTVGKMEYLL